MTKSKDGVLRATVRVEYRISDYDREVIAFVNDYGDYPDDYAEHKFRLASRKEVVEALRHGYEMEFWREEAVDAYHRIRKD